MAQSIVLVFASGTADSNDVCLLAFRRFRYQPSKWSWHFRGLVYINLPFSGHYTSVVFCIFYVAIDLCKYNSTYCICELVIIVMTFIWIFVSIVQGHYLYTYIKLSYSCGSCVRFSVKYERMHHH